MSKKSKGNKLGPTAEEVGTMVAAKPIILSVKAGVKYRGAREAWYKVLSSYDGKLANGFLEATKVTPPALTKKGVGEDPRGWLRFFVRTGTATLTQ